MRLNLDSTAAGWSKKARRFAEQARRIIAKKPLVTLKAGRSARGTVGSPSVS